MLLSKLDSEMGNNLLELDYWSLFLWCLLKSVRVGRSHFLNCYSLWFLQADQQNLGDILYDVLSG